MEQRLFRGELAMIRTISFSLLITTAASVAAERVPLPAALLGDWCLIPTQGGTPDLYQRAKSHEACYTSWIDIRQDGYEGQDGTDGPKMACRIISSTVEIIPDFHNPSSKYANSPNFSDHYTIRSLCRGEGFSWQEKNIFYVEKGLLIVERGSRPTR
jgi:hypothetical protein